MSNTCAIAGTGATLFIVTMNGETINHRQCSVKDCSAKHYCKGLCMKHYFVKRDKERTKNGYYREKELLRSASGRHRLPKLREKHRVAMQYYRSTPKYRLTQNAYQAVRVALKSGLLAKKECEVCGEQKTHAHHDSYFRDKWLSVRWLCKRCHFNWHHVNEPLYPPL